MAGPKVASGKTERHDRGERALTWQKETEMGQRRKFGDGLSEHVPSDPPPPDLQDLLPNIAFGYQFSSELIH